MKQKDGQGGSLKNQESEGNVLVESLHLSRDACLGETILTFVGRSILRIENYRSILTFTDTSIRIQAKRYKVCIDGRQLSICYYDKDEMEIRGNIGTVSFE